MCNNIILIGFMGTGKTTIGRELAKKINSILIDTDSLIETNYDMKISDFFEKYGENKFREVETNVCKWIKTTLTNTIISTGGGMPTIYNMRDLGIVFHLVAPFEEIQKRVLNDGIKNRPMLKDINNIYKLYTARLPIYQNITHYNINTLDSKENIVNKILKLKGQN